ncbi:N-6 DNA methylase [Streptomyces sp. NPDC056638]|uniref:N-6 DNA methylase n=1 Tax=Streptomyces sp. NPDC056638 TaxID=3345887 RepID=UPI0036BACF61
MGEFITAYPAERLPSGLGEVVAHHWWQRPDLIDVASPIFRWMEEDHEPGVLRAIKIVANTAIKHGVLIHTGDVDPENRSREDLLSWTISALRHESGRAGLGEVLTPDPMCDLMSYIALDVDNLPDGAWLNDPASGAGGMFRSAAQRLREAGRDPHSFRWALQDIDPMSAAGAAVNVMVWDLGIGAVVSCGDTLSEGDLTMRALAHQQAAFEHRDRMVAAASTAAALHQVERLIGRVAADGVAA